MVVLWIQAHRNYLASHHHHTGISSWRQCFHWRWLWKRTRELIENGNLLKAYLSCMIPGVYLSTSSYTSQSSYYLIKAVLQKMSNSNRLLHIYSKGLIFSKIYMHLFKPNKPNVIWSCHAFFLCIIQLWINGRPDIYASKWQELDHLIFLIEPGSRSKTKNFSRGGIIFSTNSKENPWAFTV